jgi:hypothetical protein
MAMGLIRRYFGDGDSVAGKSFTAPTSGKVWENAQREKNKAIRTKGATATRWVNVLSWAEKPTPCSQPELRRVLYK